ncbi:MAG: serine/threonine protein kinase [Myxococcaceae bacterium]|nr:serine/threonine protein kinase [Myxococcaceae bacterium]
MAHVPPKLGPFEPLHRLGAGGMAETFLAVRRGPAGFEQRVCIKRILPAYEDDPDFVDSFLDEARTSAALRHANIVQVVDFGLSESDGSHYLALELVDGMDLRALLQREHTLDPELVTLIASELASALVYAHSEDDGRPSVVHRDLSPSNVLVSRAGEVKLTDFGIARVIGGVHRTASGVIKGKVPYMPPEYIDGGHFDTRGDLFSLGVMLYELCHGRRPFDGDSELDTMRRIAAGERRPFEVPAPRALIACVDRLLQKRPEARFAHALALLDALPSINFHQTRMRLAATVRGRPSLPAAASSPSQSPFPRTVTLPPVTPESAEPTRTASRSFTGGPSRSAIYALLGAVTLMALVVVAAWVRGNLMPESAGSTQPAVSAGGTAELIPAPRRVVTLAPPQAASAQAAAPQPATGSVAPPVAEEQPVAPALVRARPSSTAPRPTAELRVVVYPFGDVWVDDKFAGQSPLSLRLSPGTHVIAVGEGRARERRTIRLKPGESESLTFRAPPATQR